MALGGLVGSSDADPSLPQAMSEGELTGFATSFELDLGDTGDLGVGGEVDAPKEVVVGPFLADQAFGYDVRDALGLTVARGWSEDALVLPVDGGPYTVALDVQPASTSFGVSPLE